MKTKEKLTSPPIRHSWVDSRWSACANAIFIDYCDHLNHCLIVSSTFMKQMKREEGDMPVVMPHVLLGTLGIHRHYVQNSCYV